MAINGVKPYVFPIVWYLLGVFIKTRDTCHSLLEYFDDLHIPEQDNRYIVYNTVTHERRVYSLKQVNEVIELFKNPKNRIYYSIHIKNQEYIIHLEKMNNDISDLSIKQTKRFLSASLNLPNKYGNNEEFDITKELNNFEGDIDIDTIFFLIHHNLQRDDVYTFKLEAITTMVETLIITTLQSS